MKIYGVAFLAACYLIGQVIGKYIGIGLGIGGNVGIAMIWLVMSNDRFYKKTSLHVETQAGVLFWSSMYIPVMVAMSSILNVKVALSNGWVAIFSGIIATSCCYLLIPLISKWSQLNLKESKE
jgi:malonate transporter MadL subunit